MDTKKDDVINGILSIVSDGYSDLNDFKIKLIVFLDDFDIFPSERLPAVCVKQKNEYLFKRFLLAKTVSGCSERTIKMYSESLHRIFKHIAVDADVATSLDFQMYMAQRKFDGKVSDVYIDNDRRVLNSFYKFLQREALITENPMMRVDKIKLPKKKKEALSDFEIEVLRSNLENEKEKAIFEMLLSTGCRVSELVSLKLKDIDGDKAVVCGKGAKYRTVYINAKAKYAVKKWIEIRKDDNPYLFPIQKRYDDDTKKRHMGAGSVETLLRKIGEKSCVENVHPHRIRRTCATNALRSGMPLELVSNMLGHESFETTRIYLDISDEDLRIAHKKYVR